MKGKKLNSASRTSHIPPHTSNNGSHTSHFQPHTSSNGITLIALVITIVIMLILVTVTVTASINGGLFGFAKQAKDQTEIGEEKGALNTSVITAMAKSRYGNTLQKEHLESSLNANIGEGRTVVIENEGVLVVKFTDSNRYYEVDSDGIISEPITIEEDKNAGDITKGETCDGTEEKPYLITCIEDLVEFSKMSETNNFSGKNVILTRTLNFNSIFSYNDYTTTEYGDLNTDGTVDDIRTELTKQGENCVGFTPITSFNGTFDGQNNKICNLYENRGTNNAGLFASSGGTIKNLGLENITLTGATVGGIAATSSNGAKILNCFVDGTSTVTGTLYMGLIAGEFQGNIEECYSKGILKLNTTATFGGIVGKQLGWSIKKCYNIMEMSSMGNMGGIVGDLSWGAAVEECYHIGNFNVENPQKGASGIADSNVHHSTIKNCYNVGEISTSRAPAGIVDGGIYTDCFNCYSVGKISSNYCGGIINGMNYGGHIVHCFGRQGDFSTLSSYNNTNGYGHSSNAKINYECGILTDDELKAQSFVDELNILIEADSEGNITETEQNVWKMDTEGINNGYPIFVWQ